VLRAGWGVMGFAALYPPSHGKVERAPTLHPRAKPPCRSFAYSLRTAATCAPVIRTSSAGLVRNT
jgi:hypothetical protein